ncbi:hypothetical protein MLD38_023205 [Melastoma candidum]|uniref:Uncharacterized protein n=1 Tax=Melastoma candidum TaxID=119954 RepID=A0ACB9QLY4_9MYRT|nr:hypothetical protein MLD38_023205 [Melastoma candidum]
MDVVALASTLRPSVRTSVSLPRSPPSGRKPSLVIASRRSSSASTASQTAAGKNFYEMLSLSPSSTSEGDVKRAFRSLALRYHPDVCDPSAWEESTRMFLMLHEAYRTLSDPVLREEYDYNLGLRAGGVSRSKGRRGSEGCRGTTTGWREQVMGLRKRRSGGVRGEPTWGSIMRNRRNSNK